MMPEEVGSRTYGEWKGIYCPAFEQMRLSKTFIAFERVFSNAISRILRSHLWKLIPRISLRLRRQYIFIDKGADHLGHTRKGTHEASG
jgi:hypothetical protein